MGWSITQFMTASFSFFHSFIFFTVLPLNYNKGLYLPLSQIYRVSSNIIIPLFCSSVFVESKCFSVSVLKLRNWTPLKYHPIFLGFYSRRGPFYLLSMTNNMHLFAFYELWLVTGTLSTCKVPICAVIFRLIYPYLW